MRIAGIQKLTLLDFPGRVACTVFTSGCNFICPFCQNRRLVIDPMDEPCLDTEELFSFLQKRKGILDGVAVTGGEPLIQKDIEAFLVRIKEMGYETKLDTNGSNPTLLRHLVDERLVDYVAVDVKNSREKYGITAGCSDALTGNVEQTVRYLLEDHVDYEFRTTVVDEFHKKEDFEAIGRWISGAKRYFLQKFEDTGEIIKDGLHSASADDMKLFLETVRPFVKEASLRGM